MPETSLKPRISAQEYLQGELASETRHEYIGGEIYAMVGASDRHGLIALNLATALRPHLRGTGCQLFVADMKLRIEAAGETAFYYPDLLLSCDPQDRETYFRSRPCLIVEVLSEATERIDRREKLFAYTQISSLREYLLLSQNRAEAELHRREPNGWKTLRFATGAVPCGCLGVGVPLDVIYEDVPLPSGDRSAFAPEPGAS
jgi:Uma2 family endonuclease